MKVNNTQYHENGSRKRKGMFVAAIIMTLMILITLGSIFIYRTFFRKPELLLREGFMNMAAEMNSYGISVINDIDLNTIVNNIAKEPVTADVVMNVTLPDLDTIGVDYITHYDYKNKKMDSDLRFSVYRIDLVSGTIKADDNRLYINLPDLTSDTYYVNMDTLGTDYNASMWPSLSGYTLPEDTSFELFPMIEQNSDSLAWTDSISQALKDKFETLVHAMVVENSDNVIEIERDGKLIKCRGIKVTIQEEVINDLLEDMFIEYAPKYLTADRNLLQLRFADDVEFCVYLDNHNRIVNISTPEKIKFTNSEISGLDFTFMFEGSERALDTITGTVNLMKGDQTQKYDIEREASADDSEYENSINMRMTNSDTNSSMNMMYKSSWDLQNKEFNTNISINTPSDLYECMVKGNFTDIQKGKSFTINIGDFELTQNDERVCHIFGSVGIRPCEETVTVSEEGKDIMGLKKDEVVSLAILAYTAITRLSSGM